MTRRGHRCRIAWALGLVMLAATLGGAGEAAADKVLDDLVSDLQLIPFDGQTPAPFELERLDDGKKVTLAEYRGRPVMLYFWATW